MAPKPASIEQREEEQRAVVRAVAEVQLALGRPAALPKLNNRGFKAQLPVWSAGGIDESG